MCKTNFPSRICEINIPLFLLNIKTLEIIDMNSAFLKVAGFATKKELLSDETFSIVSFLKNSNIILKIKKDSKAVNEKIKCIGYDGKPFSAIISAQQTEIDDIFQIIILEITKDSGSESIAINSLPDDSYMERKVSEKIAKSKIDGSKMALISLDVDHFKKVNDSYGHLCGDEVLKKVSTVFLQSMRSSDIAGRYGGEEFLLILPNTPLEKGIKVAKTFSERIKNLTFDSMPEAKVTISGGICEYNNEIKYEHLLSKVDDLLYIAKNNGRDRIEF